MLSIILSLCILALLILVIGGILFRGSAYCHDLPPALQHCPCCDQTYSIHDPAPYCPDCQDQSDALRAQATHRCAICGGPLVSPTHGTYCEACMAQILDAQTALYRRMHLATPSPVRVPASAGPRPALLPAPHSHE